MIELIRRIIQAEMTSEGDRLHRIYRVLRLPLTVVSVTWLYSKVSKAVDPQAGEEMLAILMTYNSQRFGRRAWWSLTTKQRIEEMRKVDRQVNELYARWVDRAGLSWVDHPDLKAEKPASGWMN